VEVLARRHRQAWFAGARVSRTESPLRTTIGS